MESKTYVPKPPLSHFVSSFRISRRRGERSVELALPTGTVELVINLGQGSLRVWDLDPQRKDSGLRGVREVRGGVGLQSVDSGFKRGVICGPHSVAFVIDAASDEEIIAANFRPGGLFPFLGLPSDELQNMCIAVEDVWGRRVVELHQQLVNAESDPNRFQIFERFLLRQAARPLDLDPRVAYSLKALERGEDALSIARLSDKVGLSERRFIAIFRTTTGLSPKQYMRVRRLQNVLSAIERGGAFSWADLAHMCGYYDQSHLYRDFRAMTGMSPGEYLARRGDRLNHVPVD